MVLWVGAAIGWLVGGDLHSVLTGAAIGLLCDALLVVCFILVQVFDLN